jgi:hypothetical protein
MIPQTDRRVRKHAIPELKADPAEYRRLLEDLIQSSGSLIPDPNWLAVEEVSQPAETYDKGKALERAVSRQHYLDRISKMESLMFSWVGGSERHRKLPFQNIIGSCGTAMCWTYGNATWKQTRPRS